jgi:hypothetical protein
MDAQLIQPAVNSLIDSDAVDFDALQAYLGLYVLNLRNLSTMSQARFGAVRGDNTGFHVHAEVRHPGAANISEIHQLDQRVSVVIDAARARFGEDIETRNSLSLSFFRVASATGAGAHLALI